MAKDPTPITCPHYAPEDVKNEWSHWNSGKKNEWLSRNRPGQKPQLKSVIPMVDKSGDNTDEPLMVDGELVDIRNWNEDFDGLSAERIRNCIIYQLDYAKQPWYRKVISVGYLKRKRNDLGITGAREMHENTPPGWTPDPLIKIRTIKIDRESVEIKEIAREPKNFKEWETLHSMMVDGRDKPNKAIVKKLAKKDCIKCKGKGGYNEKINPGTGVKVQWQEVYRFPCGCCSVNPFKAERPSSINNQA